MSVKLPYTAEIIHSEAVAVTCTENGMLEFWYCAECNALFTDAALTQLSNYKNCVVPAPGHVWVDPTCTADGYCSVCDAEGEAALGHSGYAEDFKCDACSVVVEPEDGSVLTIPQAIALAKALGTGKYSTNKYYVTAIIDSIYNTTYGNANVVDADGNKYGFYGMYDYSGVRYDKLTYKPIKGDEVTIYGVVGSYNATTYQVKDGVLDEVIAHTHNYDSVVTAPTCTENGFTTHTCSICLGNYTDAEVPALGHTTENGTCENCGREIGGDAIEYEDKQLSFSDKANRTTFTTSQQVWEQNGVKLINDKSSSTSNVGDYYNPARFYKSSKLTIQCAGMTKIVFVCNSSSYASALKSSIASDSNYTVSVSGSNVTVTFTNAVDSFVISSLSGGQVRVNSLTVTAPKG